MHRILLVLLLVATVQAAPVTNSPFTIRGTLPWHNFLSGPSTWDEEDYEHYLDQLQSLGLNYITFHCYTGGAERYATYVEPIIRIQYRDVLPEATFDTSLTARWGYRPLPVSEFAFGTGQLFKLPPGAQAFGARCTLLARNKREHYDRAQALMGRVVEMAHARGIQVGIGFEFGIHPPEFASIVPPQSFVRGANLPDPTHPASIEILHNTIDNILYAYPGVDWIWLWLHEHTMHIGRPYFGESFSKLYQRDGALFKDAQEESDTFTGVWSLAYVRAVHEYLARKAPRVRLAISGWGGGTQLPGTLLGLDRGLPTNIVFSCLNPSQGWDPQLPVLEEIAKHREVWAIPWLEGDARLWHLQPRVSLLRAQINLAVRQKLKGVLAIHWRTEEMRANLKAFGEFAANPSEAPTLDEFYHRDCAQQYGKAAAERITAIMGDLDREQALTAYSPEYNPYDPSWGRLRPELRERVGGFLEQTRDAATTATNQTHQANLHWLADNFEFTLLLDQVSRGLEPAYRLKEAVLRGVIEADQMTNALAVSREYLSKAPLEPLFRCYARRVRSKGELGQLSALNQRVWLAYRELDRFMQNLENEQKRAGSVIGPVKPQ